MSKPSADLVHLTANLLASQVKQAMAHGQFNHGATAQFTCDLPNGDTTKIYVDLNNIRRWLKQDKTCRECQGRKDGTIIECEIINNKFFCNCCGRNLSNA